MPGLLKGVLGSRLMARLHTPGVADACSGVRVRDPCGLGEGKQPTACWKAWWVRNHGHLNSIPALRASHTPRLAMASCQGHTLLVRSRQTHPPE